MTIYSLGPDDLPTCPKHGQRIETDFFVEKDGETYERGRCPICDKTYHFYTDSEEPISGQKLTS
jgi:hypothetical protein